MESKIGRAVAVAAGRMVVAVGGAVGLAGVAMAACAMGAPGGNEPATGVAVAAAGGQCPEWGCGANSPVIDAFGFHELSLRGPSVALGSTMPDKEGFAIAAVNGAAQLVQSGTTYDLHVEGGRLFGVDCTVSPCRQLRGASLIGATIGIVRGTASFALRISTVRTMPYFLGSDLDTVEAYTLEWTDGETPLANLCSNIKDLDAHTSAGGDTYAAQELMGMRTYEAIIFEGDRIDKDRKTMSLTPDNLWFNIGCAGHALAKLDLTRNTLYSQAIARPAPVTPLTAQQAWQHRQSTLKLLVADYCGDGTAFTIAGQNLVWQGDLMTWFGDPPHPELEARWTELGATCLDVPRLAHPTWPVGSPPVPDLYLSIARACVDAKRTVPGSCDPLDPQVYAGALRVSANP